MPWKNICGYENFINENQRVGYCGGFNGTFSPNAAYVQSPFVMSAGTTYRFSLKWKTNRNAPGVTIFIGAGTGPSYSPTRLTAETVSC